MSSSQSVEKKAPRTKEGYLLTEEQVEILRAVITRGENVVIPAFAGAAKSTTGIEITRRYKHRDQHHSVLAIMFNKELQLDSAKRFPEYVKVSTCHALAYQAVVKPYRDAGKFGKSVWEIQKQVADRFDLGRVCSMKTVAIRAVMATVNAFLSSAESIVEVRHIPEAFSTQVQRREVVDIAQQIFHAMKDLADPMPITHDTYLKIWALQRPQLPFKLIICDEWQDATAVLHDLIMRQRSQIIIVGDSHQAIYQFRGTTNALAQTNYPSYPLTQSWRFGASVAQLANEILATKGEKLQVVGKPNHVTEIIVHSSQRDKVPNAVIGRTNAGLFEEAVRVIPRLGPNERISFAGAGSAGVSRFVKTIKAAHALMTTGATQHPDLKHFNGLDAWEHLKVYVENSDPSDMLQSDWLPFAKMVMKYESRPHEVIRMCDLVESRAATDDTQSKIIFSTMHQSKGREWSHVKLIDDHAPFCRLNKAGDEYVYHESEANLSYMAITRAIDILDIHLYEPILQAAFSNCRAMSQNSSTRLANRIRERSLY